MAETTPNAAADESIRRSALHRIADGLSTAYKLAATERARLHDLMFDRAEPRAEDALYLLTVPMDEVINIGRMCDAKLDDQHRERFAAALSQSPLADQQVLVEWLRDDAHFPQIASLIERADYLRLVLISQLVPLLPARKSA